MDIKRGSEWRRWEFHLHTPFTKKKDCFTGRTSEEKWDNFYSSINKYIGDGKEPLRSICAIAITDYLSIDNYIKVRNDKRLPDCVKFIFPNVELRIKPIAKESPINIHCLFDPSIADDLQDRFFANLKFEYNNNQYAATRAELIRLGRTFKNDPSLPDENAFLTGLSQYVISYEVLSDLFKKNPLLREKTIIVVSNKSSDGASGLQHSDYLEGSISQLEATRRSIYQLADMVFSANPKDIKYFLGEGADNPNLVKEKCGSLMPCIHGCDAHSNTKIFTPDDERFCWIKADPSFEGLKQVLYEPKERVRICNTIPDGKPSYYVIDRVEIIGNDDFSPEPIYFNDKLTCIIGGKSTGKSLLLNNMAMAIDEEQAKAKQEIAKVKTKYIPELQVYWRDGCCSSDKNNPKKIIYIPQSYLNRLSDEGETVKEIDTLIQEIILQNSQCASAYNLMNTRISQKEAEVIEKIAALLKIVSAKVNLIDKCKTIGNQNSIQCEIQQFNIELERISKLYDFTDEEINQYQDAIEKIKKHEEQCIKISSEINIINDIDSIVEIKYPINGDIVIYNEIFSQIAEEVKRNADEIWSSKRNEILKQAYNMQNNLKLLIEGLKDITVKLRPKMECNERIKRLNQSMIEAKDRLAKLNRYIDELKDLEKQYKLNLNILGETFSDFSKIYHEYIEKVNTHFNSSTEDLEFSTKKIFCADKFLQRLLEMLDNRSISRFTAFDIRNLTEEMLSSKNIILLIENILQKSKESLQCKSGYSTEYVLRAILSNWYKLGYTIKMDNDNIQCMSPGKKALVLLRLLISIAEMKCPILIDQPEDDLDNRSIFNELTHFIREKKIDRQIIIVTHNANIVIGGDAELVIVANQQGDNAPNKNFRFEYRGGAIEENTQIINNNKIVPGILNSKGIQEHICEILEGGEQAFALRHHKYNFIKK